tara:strand:- start:9033 stop:9956 length:924 start_codon:yes stop_codon:yes gene_type:complete
MAQIYHTYGNVYDFKAYLGGTDHVTDWTTDETPVLRVLEAASKRIDSYMGRSFGARTETHSFDLGQGALRDDSLVPNGDMIEFPDYWTTRLQSTGILGLDDWLITATTVTSFEGTDRTSSATLSEGIGNDFLLMPYNTSPKSKMKLVENTLKNLYSGQQTLTILGEWGWQNDTESISTVDAIGSTSTTTVTVSSGSTTYVGDTILVGTEQMYVTNVDGNTLTVIRAVNGTTAATHSGGATYYRYKYPADVVQACLDVARTYWRSRDVGQSQILGTNEMQMTYPQNEERIILKKLDHYLNKRETAIYV